MKLVDIKKYDEVTVKKFTGKRRKNGKWTPVVSVYALSDTLSNIVEFTLINDFGQYVVSMYFSDGWSPEKLASEGIANEKQFSEIVENVEKALKDYFQVV